MTARCDLYIYGCPENFRESMATPNSLDSRLIANSHSSSTWRTWTRNVQWHWTYCVSLRTLPGELTADITASLQVIDSIQAGLWLYCISFSLNSTLCWCCCHWCVKVFSHYVTQNKYVFVMWTLVCFLIAATLSVFLWIWLKTLEDCTVPLSERPQIHVFEILGVQPIPVRFQVIETALKGLTAVTSYSVFCSASKFNHQLVVTVASVYEGIDVVKISNLSPVECWSVVKKLLTHSWSHRELQLLRLEFITESFK